MELRIILGDQLNEKHSWFREPDPDVRFLMMEILPESEYVRHHIQKICAIFAAMRRFRDFLTERGHYVDYLEIDEPDNLQSFEGNILMFRDMYAAHTLMYMEPDEHRLDRLMSDLSDHCGMSVHMVSSEHFMTNRLEIREVFSKRKAWVMEFFYRYMRKKHNILVDGDGEPVGGQWNFDKDNRKKLPTDQKIQPPLLFHHDIRDVLDSIEKMGIESIGSVNRKDLNWPLDRRESLELLDYFGEELLPQFGDYQDAISIRSWTLFHSRLSFSLNMKMISPAEVIEYVIKRWEKDPAIGLNSVEGFIRQILGWREFMRGMYWHNVPQMREMNYFGHSNRLPSFYWDGNTHMECLSHAIRQSLEYAYAHHIQRLMITGNFALLAGTDPAEVDEWYLGIYADAFEWVELPNTRGMSQFADGGQIATKPYVSSAAYIKKMSDHCSGCEYDPSKKTGKNACPFNSLYWHFLFRHRDKLESNQRMSMMYRVWDKMKNRSEILDQAEDYLNRINSL